MLKFVLPLALVAFVPVTGVQAEASTGKSRVAACHPEWGKSMACRANVAQAPATAVASAAPAACHPEWGKSQACAIRAANANETRQAKADSALRLAETD